VASSQYLIAEDYAKISFYRTFIGAIVNIVLNIIMIPKYGINGAAVATLVSYFVSVFSIVLIPKTCKNSILILKSLSLVGGPKRVLER